MSIENRLLEVADSRQHISRENRLTHLGARRDADSESFCAVPLTCDAVTLTMLRCHFT